MAARRRGVARCPSLWRRLSAHRDGHQAPSPSQADVTRDSDAVPAPGGRRCRPRRSGCRGPPLRAWGPAGDLVLVLMPPWPAAPAAPAGPARARARVGLLTEAD